MGSPECKLGPNERPSWGESFATGYGKKSLITPKGKSALEKALSLYAPYTSEEIEQSEGRVTKIANESLPLVDQAVEGIIIQIQNRYVKKGVLQRGILEIITEIENAILPKYKEYGISGMDYGEGLVFSRLMTKVKSYLITLIALREESHKRLSLTPKQQRQRSKRLQQMRREGESLNTTEDTGDNAEILRQIEEQLGQKFLDQSGISFGTQGYSLPRATLQNPHSQLFQIFKDAEGHKQEEGIDEKMKRNPAIMTARLFLDQYVMTKAWISFLRQKMGKFANPEARGKEVLKRENDRVSRLLVDGATRVYPEGITIENHTALHEGGAPITVHVTGLSDPGIPIYYDGTAAVSYLEGADAEKVIGNIDLQREMSPGTNEVNGVEYSTFAIMGERPLVVLRRDGGIEGPLVSQDSLNMIAGKSAALEILRRDILFVCSQLSCPRRVLFDMWGEAFKPTQKLSSPSLPRAADDTQGEKDPIDSTNVERSYPGGSAGTEIVTDDDLESIMHTLAGNEEIEVDDEVDEIPVSDVAESVEDTLESVRRAPREHPVSGYRRTQPLIQRNDGTYTAPKPSQRAIANAQLELRKGVQIPSQGKLFKPDQVGKLLARAGVETPEEFVEMFPEEAYLVYETWVSKYTRGNPKMGKIETVTGSIQEGIDGALDK